jgi:enoyl-CoA hydratase/carnithine racemase
MAYQSFIYEVQDGIATVRLNDPERLNALTFETYAELEKLTAELANEDTAKVLVLTGTGKGFCSGGSVNEIIGKLVQMKGEELYRFTRMTCNVVKNMRKLKKPILAAVNGIAAGAGAMLALASDLRIVSDKARFSFLFVKVGLAGADMGALYLLPQIVGQGRAAELVYLGDTIDAQEAHRIGLANRVVAHDKLMEEAYTLARRLKDGPLYALGVTKELLNLEANTDLETALEIEAMAQARCMETPDFLEGYRAFLEKRPQQFNKTAAK